MQRLLALFRLRTWTNLLRAAFGDFHYKAPPWARATSRGTLDSMQGHPGAWAATIVILGLAIGGGWWGYTWWEAHKPRPTVLVEKRKATGKLNPPLPTTIVKGKPVIQPVVLRFDASCAPVEKIGKPAGTEVELTPAHAGQWKWSDDKTLTFIPEKDWPAGTEFKVNLQTGQLPAEMELAESSFPFATRELLAGVKNFNFYTDPTNPSLHQVVAELEFNYPVELSEVEKKVRLEVLGQTRLFHWKGEEPKALFTVTEGKLGRQFFVRSSRITVPEKEDFVNLVLGKDIPTTNGGKPTQADVTAKVRVPDVNSGFFIAGARAEILRTEEGEPEQYLFVDTRGYADGDQVAKHLEVWFAPPITLAENEQPLALDAELTAEVKAKFKLKPLELKRVETEQDAETGETTAHAFKFLMEEHGRLLVRVKSGINAMGGFKLAQDHSQFVEVPTFPREIEILGKGGLLALHGERKLGIKSRGVPFVRITLARVPLSQVQHLARFTEGDFDSPYFRLYMDESNIAHFHREVRQLPMHNEYEAAYTTFDFTEALSREDLADTDASRGMYFVKMEGVLPNPKGKKRLTGEGALVDWRSMRQDDDLQAVVEAPSEAEPAADEEEEESADEEGEEYSEDAENGVYAKRFILITDLGLIVKTNANQTREVFVAGVKNGEPLVGVDLTILAKNGEHLAKAVTDAEGRASLPDVSKLRMEKTPVAILARTGNDVAFLPFRRDDRNLDFSRFDIEGVLASEKNALDASLFTERGVYRPGDAIHLSGIVRSRDWQGELEGIPLELEILNSKDDVVATEKLVLPADGFFDVESKTDETDPTGVYAAALYLVRGDENRVRLGRVAFRVEDFQPDRMKSELAFSVPSEAGWMKPADVEAVFTLKTLFGFPAAKRLVKGSLELSSAHFAFEAYPDYIFHNRLLNETRRLAGDRVELGEQQTNEEGVAKFALGLERFEGGCFRMDVNLEAFEPDGGRSVRSGKTVLVAPFDYVVGYRQDGALGYITKDSTRQIKWLAVGPDLKTRAVQNLTRRVIQIRHVSVLTKLESGSYAYVSTPRESILEETAVDLTAEGLDYALPSTVVGDFRVELCDVDNRVISLCPFTIVGKGDPGRSLERNAELELQLAKGEWNSGEELELNYRAPYTGTGLITIERDGVLAARWFKATATAGTERIRVPDGLEGTAYVNVSFVRALDSPEIFMSPLSYAVKSFTANPDSRRMTVALDTPTVVKPGQELKIGYKTSKPGRVIVYAVDAGIHQITDYQLPDPLSYFFRKRALEVETEQLLDMLLPEFSLLQKQKAFGGDEDAALKMNLNPFKRRKDAPVVFWSGLLEADEQRREVTYTVPDYFAGQLNVMVVAVAPDAMASAATKSVVRGPMVLTPNVPVFAAPGDEFTASLTVANNLEGPDAVGRIALSLESSSQLEVLEGGKAELEVAPGKEATARFRVKVKEQLGGAELIFLATAGNEKMERRATLSVRPAAPYLTTIQSGYFRLAKQDVTVGRSLYDEYARRNVVASTLPLGLARGLESYLAEFPYGCSEQVTSRAMGRLLLANEADFGYDKAEAARVLTSAFSLLRARQNSNGGFGYWDSGVDAPLDYLSIYVSHFLIEAQESGYAVPATLINGARKRLGSMARANAGSLYEYRMQAAAIYLLTRSGEVTTNQLLNLRDSLNKREKDNWQADLTATYMAATYVLLKQPAEGETLLSAHRKALHDAAGKTEEKRAYFYGDDPDMVRALDFALTCRHFPTVARKFGYHELSPITTPIAEGRFNTLSAAHTILALKAYAGLAEKADVKLGLSALLRDGAEPQLLLPLMGGLLQTSFGPDVFKVRVELEQGKGADLGAFYQVVEAGYDKGLPQERLANGLEIHREFVDGEGNVLEKLRVGEGCTVRITVRNISPANQSNLALLDLLPGGFEIEPGNLRPGKNAMAGADFVDVREDRNIFFCHLDKGQSRTFTYRVKPVAAGTFVIPPAMVESMYNRGLNARAGGGQVVVETHP